LDFVIARTGNGLRHVSLPIVEIYNDHPKLGLSIAEIRNGLRQAKPTAPNAEVSP
jgi:hypothetical protein